MGKTMGIDLGTSNSAAAVMMKGKPTIVPSAEGLIKHGKMFPSLVTFKENGEVMVGKQEINPERTIMAIKRRMGTDYEINIDGRKYTPQDLSAMILKKIKEDAEKYIGEKIEKAVITVPAYFNDNQRQATKNAGIIAGLSVLRIINEPTAASLAYGLDKVKEALKITVLDLGGGTFDITILEMKEGIFKVISTSGDTQLGGKDMDDKIIDYLLEEFKKKYNVDLKDDKKSMQMLREAAENAKIELSTALSTTISLTFSIRDSTLKFNTTLTRAKLEGLIKDVIDKLDMPIKQALKDSNLLLEDIDKIILVGGPTRMPVIREKFENFFGKKAEEGINPMECVAIGAAIQGSILRGDINDMTLLDVTPLSLGIETSGGIFTKLIKRNTTIPTEETRVFTTSKDNQESVAVHILQGERAMTVDNITLGVFNLTGIRPAPRYEPDIEVTFDIDADGILHVSAEDLETNKEQKIEVTGAVISKKVREQLIKEAEEFAKKDEKWKEKIEAINHAKALIYGAEKTIKEISKISKHEKDNLAGLIEELKKALKHNIIERIKKYSEELTKSMDKITEKIEKLRLSKQANTLINQVKKAINEWGDKISENEKNNVNKIIGRLQEKLKKGNTKEIKKYTKELKNVINLMEVDHGGILK